ncbi:MAG: hypothetical protein LBD62_00810 [Candidatus Margulisbacteria bacterium]|jgi:ATP-dependent Zn protease|nr:hypothetical protein [Candidatus Margulisiibacteriota bacterium]
MGKEYYTPKVKTFFSCSVKAIQRFATLSLDLAYKRAQDILQKNKAVMEKLAQELMKKEVLEGKEFDEILESVS